jgi:hypothetical protein
MRTLCGALLGLLLAAPVQADILGQNGTGANTRTLDGFYRCSTGTLPSNVAAGGYSVKAYIEDTSGAGDTFRAVLFNGSDDTTIISYSNTRTDIAAINEYDFPGGTFSSVALTSGTVLRICVGSNSAAGAISRYPDDGIVGYAGTVNNINTPSITGSLAVDGGGRKFIVFLDYTPDGGGGGSTTTQRLLLGVGH